MTNGTGPKKRAPKMPPKKRPNAYQAKALAEYLVQDANDARVHEEVAERVPPGALPADEVAQVRPTCRALERLVAAGEHVAGTIFVIGAVDAGEMVVVVDCGVAGVDLVRRQHALQVAARGRQQACVRSPGGRDENEM